MPRCAAVASTIIAASLLIDLGICCAQAVPPVGEGCSVAHDGLHNEMEDVCDHHHHEHSDHDRQEEDPHHLSHLHSNWYATFHMNGEAGVVQRPLIFRAANGLAYLTPFNLYDAIDASRMSVGVVFYYVQNSALCEEAYNAFVAAVDGYRAACGGTDRVPCGSAAEGRGRVMFGQMDLTLLPTAESDDEDAEEDEQAGRAAVRSNFGPNRSQLDDFPVLVVMWWREEEASNRMKSRLVINGFSGPLSTRSLIDAVNAAVVHSRISPPLENSSDVQQEDRPSVTFVDGVLHL